MKRGAGGWDSTFLTRVPRSNEKCAQELFAKKKALLLVDFTRGKKTRLSEPKIQPH